MNEGAGGGVDEAYGYATRFKSSPAYLGAAGVDGEHTPAGQQHEPRDLGLPEIHPLGDGESASAKSIGNAIGASAPLKFADVAERFRNNTRLRFKPGASTSDYYLANFKRLWIHAQFEGKTKRQIGGKWGRAYILRFMETIPLPSRRTVLASLECCWVEGLELPWPINRQRDFGKTLPPIGTRSTPENEDVRPWFDAALKEPDSFTRLLVLLLLCFGWRPANQIGRIKWRNVRYDQQGGPCAIVAGGAEEGFKTRSNIVAHLPPLVADALTAWKKACSSLDPNAPIMMHVPRGKKNPRPLNNSLVECALRSFERRWGLKHLAPALFRHWVKTVCRRLSDPALAALQGHAPPKDGSMRHVYDTPSIERILDEQATEFPDGALGILRPPTVSVAPEYQAELQAVIEWKAGRMSLVQLMTRLEELQRRQLVTAPLGP